MLSRGLPAPPPGIGLAYETAAAKLTQQLSDIDQLDTKAGVGIAALVAGVGAFIALPLSSLDRYVGGALLIFSVAAALYAVFVRRYADAPNPEALASYAGFEPERIKELFLPAILEAVRQNEVRLRWKARLLNGALLSMGLLALLAVCTRAMNITG